MNTPQIIILGNDVDVVSGSITSGSFAVNGVMWLQAPPNKVVPLPAFQSAFPNVSPADLLSLQLGNLVEQRFQTPVFGIVSGTVVTTSQIQGILTASYAQAQAALNASAPASSSLSNVAFDGTTWSTPPVLSSFIGPSVIALSPPIASVGNNTATPLLANAAFTGSPDDVLQFAAIDISVLSDKASADQGLLFEWSQDNVTFDFAESFTISANVGQAFSLTPRARFFRLSYSNGPVTQTAFRLTTTYSHNVPTGFIQNLDTDVSSQKAAPVIRAIVAAQKPGGGYANVLANASGSWKVAVESFPAIQQVAAPQGAPLWVTGSLFVTDEQVVTIPQPLQVWQQGPVGVSGSVAVNNWPAVVGVSSSAALEVFSRGTLGVSGTVSISNSELSVSNFPATQDVSGSVALTNWPSNVGVTGSVNVYTSGPQGISGSVLAAITNWPALHGVTGSVNVYTSGLQGVSGTVTSIIGNWPATVGVSGTVAISNSELSVSNFPATQNVSGAVALTNWPALHGVTGSVNVYTSGLQGISGSVSAAITNWPSIVGISGSVGVTNFPVTQNVSGSVNVSVSGSTGLLVSRGTALSTGSMGVLPGLIKASSGSVWKLWVTSRNSGIRYIQLFDKATAPTAGNVPVAAWEVPGTAGNAIATVALDYAPYGWQCANGISLGFSTTNATYTAGLGTDCDVSIIYK